MKYAMTSAGLALALSIAMGSTAATAQRVKHIQADKPQQAKAAGSTITVGDRELVISAAATPAVGALQAAVNANDTANIPAKLAEAKAAAKSPDEKYIVAKLQLQAAMASKNSPAIIAASNEVLAAGLAPRDEQIVLYRNLAKLHLDAKQQPQAEAALQKLKALDPGNADAAALSTALTASSLASRSPAEQVAELQKMIAASKAGGQKPGEDLYKRAVATAFNAKMPGALAISRSWVQDYPTASNWRDALQIYIKSGLDDATILDTLRLARAANALVHEADYQEFGYLSARSPAPAEGKAVIEEGIAAGKVNANDQKFKDILAEATKGSQGQQSRLPALVSDAKAAPTAKLAQNAGDILYSYNDFAQAAELYRAALTKSGADKDLLNLRLGAALARAGDKAGATAALNAVGGKRAELAKFWQVYLQTRA